MRRSFTKRYLSRIILVAASCLFALGVGEVMARLFSSVWGGSLVVARPMEDSQFIVERFKPSAIFEMERGTTARINRNGFRGDDFPSFVPHPDTVRIACLGDSFTFGHNVDDDQTWPIQLARILDAAEAAGSREFEVLNFGLVGIGTEHEAALLREQVLSYHPDVVVLQWFENDWEPSLVFDNRVIFPSMGRAFIATPKGSYIPIYSSLPKRISHPLINNSALCRWIFVRLYNLKRRFGKKELVERHARTIVEMSRVCKEHESDFIVVLFPNTGCVMEDLTILRSYPDYRTVREAAEANDIRLVDLYLEFKGIDLPAMATWDGHYNVEGNRRVAEVLARTILDKTHSPAGEPHPGP